MNKLNLFAMAMATSMIFSCAKDDSKNNAAVKDGNCTPATINAYNSVVYANDGLSKYSTLSDLYSLQSACNSYKNLIGSNSCKLKLVNKKTFISQDATVNRSSHDSICNKVDTAISEINKPKTDVVIPDINAPDDLLPLISLSSAFKEILSAKILDFSILMQATKDLSFIQSGKTFALDSRSRDLSQPYCVMISTELNSETKAISFKTFKLSESKAYVEISNSDKNNNGVFTHLSCFAGAGKQAEDLTIKDLKKVFKGLIEIKYEITD